MSTTSIFVLAPVVIVISLILIIVRLKQYKRSSGNQLLVITGKVNAKGFKIIHYGAVFVWPLLQEAHFLDLEPHQLRIELGAILLKDNVEVQPVARITCAVSTKEDRVENAVKRILGMERPAIASLAEDLVRGTLGYELMGISSTDLDAVRQAFIAGLRDATAAKLAEVGLDVIAFEFA